MKCTAHHGSYTMASVPPSPPNIALPEGWSSRSKSGLLHAVSLAQFAMTVIRGWCANSPIARVRLASENERLRAEVHLHREELRIKDDRMARIAPRQRPQYSAIERLAILKLARDHGWTADQTAARFPVTSATIASWQHRDPDPAERPEPVNRFPTHVRALVRQLKRVRLLSDDPTLR